MKCVCGGTQNIQWVFDRNLSVLENLDYILKNNGFISIKMHFKDMKVYAKPNTNIAVIIIKDFISITFTSESEYKCIRVFTNDRFDIIIKCIDIAIDLDDRPIIFKHYDYNFYISDTMKNGIPEVMMSRKVGIGCILGD